MTLARDEGRNPWPCERCGNAVTLARRVGRLPPGALVAATALLCVMALMARHAGSEALPVAALVALTLLLTVVLGLHARATEAWVCERCGRRSRARLKHSGPVLPAVIVPTFDNAGSIADVVRRVAAAAPDLPIVVVDDGSRDGTGERARAALAAAGAAGTVLSHSKNRGKGAAIVTGLRAALAAGYSHGVTLDGDGQHFPEDLARVRRVLAEAPAAVIAGARDLSGDTVGQVSRFGRRFSNFWLWAQTGRRLLDSQSGFRVYPTAPVLSLGARARAYDFEVEVLVLAARAGVPLVSVPIGVHYPAPGERVSHFDLWWDNLRISWVNVRLLAAAPLWPLGWPARLSRVAPPAATGSAWSGRSRGGALGHAFFFGVLKLLGRRAAYLFLYPVALYFLAASRRQVRASRSFLDASMGPPGGRRQALRRSYRHVLTFSQCILDRAAAQVSGARGFTWSSQGAEHFSRPGEGALLLSAHLGNYEMGGALLHLSGLPLNVVMLDAEAAAVKAVHERFGERANSPRVIAINRGEFPSLEVLAALRRGELVALHGDRVIDGRWVWCDFFGRPAPFPTGAFLLAAAARVPVVLTFGFKEGPSRYRFVAESPRRIELPRERRDEALAEQARWYAGRLEHYARAYPLQWFNFYDFWAMPAQPSTPAITWPRRPARRPGG